MRPTSALVFAIMLAVAVPVSAQITSPSGTVKYVDLVTNTVHFTDGRIVHMKPGSQLLLDGTVVAFNDVRPGMTVVLKEAPAAATTGTAAAMGTRTATSTSIVLGNHPPVNASGVVASVDRQAGEITFQDGRVLKLTNQMVWQAIPLDRVQPGHQVWVNDARPVAFQSSRGGERMGTVARVDEARQAVVLTDGAIVRLRPGAAVTMSGQRMRIIDLQAGDEIVVRLDQGGTTTQAQAAGRDSHLASASPRTEPFATATAIEASEILIVRRHQAP